MATVLGLTGLELPIPAVHVTDASREAQRQQVGAVQGVQRVQGGDACVVPDPLLNQSIGDHAQSVRQAVGQLAKSSSRSSRQGTVVLGS